MPVEVTVTFTDGSTQLFYIPLQMMRWEKPAKSDELNRKVVEDWAWAYPTHSFTVDAPKSEISTVEIDANARMADIKRENNLYKAVE
jgi:hypothetical protein